MFQWYQTGHINGSEHKSYSISIKTNLGEYTVKVTDEIDYILVSKLTINNYIPNPSVTVIQPNCHKIQMVTLKHVSELIGLF
jgi:hypothetical protein